ncbi:MAG: glycine zipper 2TM domain-containing protein [Sulfuricaulis sp.]|uniref:glycine zipper 2TM domain-containing protein n=1 Tax=Sulfuricaulis sp. TaxID=2003553 RepID=UPI0025D67F37|nr:glycine zipper 2TM domain-containing protein [Sulfuricaulis sp.]MCR4347904.1 glycine zipper 2TM domain-containing protein [Sulfuricaulis sp.]
MPLSTIQIAAITSAAIAVGGVAAVKTGVVQNPFQSAGQAEAPANTGKSKVAKASPVVCRECGVVESIDTFTEKGQASGGGAIAGGVIGAIVGHQIGSGRGKDLATVAGGVGGAIAGNEIEKNTKKVTRYRIALRMDDGTRQQLTLNAANGVNVGDKVKIVDGTLVRN